MAKKVATAPSTQLLAKTVKVDSSMLDAVSHDTRTLTMYAKFKNGGVYSYFPVYAETFDAITSSNTVGTTFSGMIKKNDKLIVTKIF